MKEIWKDITGYEGLYQVSNTGLVRSLVRKNRKKEKILKVSKHSFGYLQCSLSKNNMQTYHRIHKLVAQAFIPNPDNLPCVLHKDDNPTNNNVNNLVWGTYNDNIKDMVKKGRNVKGENQYNCILTEQQVLQVVDYIEMGMKSIDISKILQISHSNIKNIRYGKSWNWLTKIK